MPHYSFFTSFATSWFGLLLIICMVNVGLAVVKIYDRRSKTLIAIHFVVAAIAGGIALCILLAHLVF